MKFIVTTFFIFLGTFAFAKDVKMVTYDYQILRIIDGDTVVFQADFLPAPLKTQLSLRIYGVDTPEKSWRAECDLEAKHGEEASKFTQSRINAAQKIRISIYKWDKFGGRVLGDVLLDGESLRKLLIEKGFAREYYGDKKKSWCN